MTKKLYYNISEVAKLTNLSETTLRHWEQNITKLKPNKDKRGIRRYQQADIDLIKRIAVLQKEHKLTLKGIEQQLNNNPSGDPNEKMIKQLKKLREVLTELRDSLE